MTGAALIDVVIPVFNGEKYIAEAIESALGQTHSPTVITVVDDGSTDRTREIVGRYPVRYLRQENGGVASACNAGLAVAEGEFISFLGADDVWLPRKLERQLEALEAQPDCGYALCHVRNFVDSETKSWLPPEEMGVEMPAVGSGVWLVRRAVFDVVGPFDVTYRVSEDLEWLARATAAGVRRCNVAELLVLRRVHEGNLTRDVEPQKRAVLRLLRESAMRRRQKQETST